MPKRQRSCNLLLNIGCYAEAAVQGLISIAILPLNTSVDLAVPVFIRRGLGIGRVINKPTPLNRTISMEAETLPYESRVGQSNKPRKPVVNLRVPPEIYSALDIAVRQEARLLGKDPTRYRNKFAESFIERNGPPRNVMKYLPEKTPAHDSKNLSLSLPQRTIDKLTRDSEQVRLTLSAYFSALVASKL